MNDSDLIPSVLPETVRPGHPWVAIQTRPHHERVAAINLEQRGLDTYLPVYRTKRQWSDRKRTMDLPLFTSYLFCRYQKAIRQVIVSSFGVNRIVSFGGEPVPVTDDELEAIRRIVASGLECAPEKCYQVGEHVRVTGGALCGLEGVVTGVRHNRGWLIVSLPMLQRAVGVAIDRELLAPVSKNGRTR